MKRTPLLTLVPLLSLSLWLACSRETLTPTPEPALSAGAGGGLSVLAGQGGLPLAGFAGSPLDAGAAGVAGFAEAGAAGVAEAGAAGAAGSPLLDCPSAPGPAMVRIPTHQGSFCIDSTEVSQADYGAFVAANLPLKGQPEMCPYNSSWTPQEPDFVHGGGCVPPEWDFMKQTGPANRPMVCVNWCDARAYCEWAGKRLCGKVGGGELSEEEVATPASEHVFTCTQGGLTTYPYGNQYKGSMCELSPSLKGENAVLSEMSTCRGVDLPFSQVRDLVGNVDEWSGGAIYKEDGDSGDFRWFAPVQFSSVSTTLTAAQSNCLQVQRTALSMTPTIGFRCCAD